MSSLMPVGLQRAFANSLFRLPGDVVQRAINGAAADFGVEGTESLMNVYWQLYAAKGLLTPGDFRLQYLYTQRECLTDLGRRVFDFTTSTEAGIETSDSDVFKALSAMRMTVDADIKLLETQIRSSQAPVGGVMTTTQPPVSPPSVCPNPADPYYRADPLARRGWPW